MDTIVPVTLPKVAKFMEALASRGVGDKELQATLENVVLLNQIAALMVPPLDIDIDLSGEFDEAAMERLVEHIFKTYTLERRNREREAKLRPGKYVWISGYLPEHLADTHIMKQLFDGLSDRHVAVAVLRSGLLDGREVPVNEVVQRLGLRNGRHVSHLRTQANAHIVARARELYPFGRWVRAQDVVRPGTAQSVTPDSFIEAMALTNRTYNCLDREGIRTVAELMNRTRDDLMDIRNFSQSCLDEVELVLDRSGLRLCQD